MFAHTLLLAITAVSILLMLLRPKGIAEVWWVGAGAMLLVVLRLIPARVAAHAVGEGTDVYLFLIGMMMLSELAKENGVFDWVARLSVKSARGSGTRLFAWIYGVGTLVTITMSNDATAVVLTPAVLAAVRRARVEPVPFLLACAMIANAASFVLPISNPANLVVFHAGLPPLGRWLATFLLPSAASIAATYLVLRLRYRGALQAEVASDTEDQPLSGSGRLVLAGLGLVVAVLLVASSLRWDLGLPTALAAAVVTAAVSIQRRVNPLPLLREVSWSTLALVAALFILVAGVENIGALHATQAALAWAQRLPATAGAAVVAGVVAVGNNLVNNLPLGLLAGATLTAAHVHGLLANSVLIGVDLGPNLSVTGSLATILWLLALRREDVHVSAMDFLKAGALAMPAALAAAMAALLTTHH